MRRYRQLAANTGLWLSIGGFQETGPDPQHLYNCHAIISSAGEIVESYRWRQGFSAGHSMGHSSATKCCTARRAEDGAVLCCLARPLRTRRSQPSSQGSTCCGVGGTATQPGGWKQLTGP